MWSAATPSPLFEPPPPRRGKYWPADDQSDLNTCAGDLGNLHRERRDPRGIDSKSAAPGEHLAAQLQQDALVICHQSLRNYSAAGVSAAPVSPTLNRTKRDTVMFSPSLAILVLIRSAMQGEWCSP